MTDLSELLRQGSDNVFLLVPGSILLGALHGMEPGHSKTMMAAFIIAIRGTVAQAVMLGVAATISHTLVVWVIAMGGMMAGERWNVEGAEHWLQSLSGLIIIGMSLWMLRRVARLGDHGGCGHDHGHGHSHDHEHGRGHARGDESKGVDTGHGFVRLEIHEDGVPARFRLYPVSKTKPYRDAGEVTVVTERADGARECFAFVARDGFVESVETIPEPHEFIARLTLAHGDHRHDFDVEFTEAGHSHVTPETAALEKIAQESADPHELAHANDIRRRFSGRNVTNGQILVFGLTGGLIPCPAAITVLMLCLQLKKVALGAVLVTGFGVGLALTLVASGVLAALSLKFAAKRWAGFGALSKRAPYFSGGLMLVAGLYILIHGLLGFQA